MARPPKIPSRGDEEANVYAPKPPGSKVMEYDDMQEAHLGAELPGVAPPSAPIQTMPAPQPQQYGMPPAEAPRAQPPAVAAAPAPVLAPGPVLPPPPPPDPTALNILQLVQGGRFAQPFVVTLMRKSGTVVRQSATGSKPEDEYKLCQLTIREPADLISAVASLANGSLKPLNQITLELQLLLYIAHQSKLLVGPQAPVPTAKPLG